MVDEGAEDGSVRKGVLVYCERGGAVENGQKGGSPAGTKVFSLVARGRGSA